LSYQGIMILIIERNWNTGGKADSCNLEIGQLARR